MAETKYYNILDFGSSKIRFSVFDTNNNKKFSKNKEVLYSDNYESHFNNLDAIIKEAEKKISFHIEDIILVFDSVDLVTIDISLKKNIDKNSEAEKIYNLLLLELNQLINTYYNNQYLIHVLIDKCVIDDKEIFTDLPKRKFINNNLKIDFKIICLPKILVNKIKKKFTQNNLKITNIFSTSYIKSYSYAKKLNKNEIFFLEIGWQRTSLFFYKINKLKFINTIPIGGNHISKDIAKIFKISLEDSERLKKSFSKSDTEFSYSTNSSKNIMLSREILDKNISVDLLKKVILYRIQEIIDLSFEKFYNISHVDEINNTDLFLIGEGSMIFNDNSFHLNDRFKFKSINFYSETDLEICNCALTYNLNNSTPSKINVKKHGIFEAFFNYFGK